MSKLVKYIINESLLTEIGEASAMPYEWDLVDSDSESAQYLFRTVGGSDVTIDMSFYLLYPFQLYGLKSDEDKRKFDKNSINKIKNPYYYWDTGFQIVGHHGKRLDWLADSNATISNSEYKTDKVEVFRIMATVSQIMKNFMKLKKVRGFAFRPSTDSRGNVYLKYIQKQLPKSEVLRIDGGTIVTVNPHVTYNGREDEPYHDYYQLNGHPPYLDRFRRKLER